MIAKKNSETLLEILKLNFLIFPLQLTSTLDGQGLNTPLGQSPALAGSQMQQSNPAFLPGYLMGQPQQVMKKMELFFPTIFFIFENIFF